MTVDLMDVKRGQDVIVDGRRVPLLEAIPEDGGRVLLVFDRRIGLSATVAHLDETAAFVAAVIEGAMNPDSGRTFNRVFEITAAEEAPDA